MLSMIHNLRGPGLNFSWETTSQNCV